MASNATITRADETQENIDVYTVRLVVRLGGMFGPAGGRTAVCCEARRLIRIHPEIRHWHQWAKERLEDQAIQEYFANYCAGRNPTEPETKTVQCGCGAPASHHHGKTPCCGGSMCCSKANV
jgi:hypothetical protein